MIFRLTFPSNYAVFQRNKENMASIPIHGKILLRFSRSPITVQANYNGIWINILENWKKASFKAELVVPSGGWYTLQVRILNKEKVMATSIIEKIGVGEVFIISGQSNSANHGSTKQQSKSGKVVAWGPKGWQIANDPQPIATGVMGSPWPAMGDYLVEKLQVPIGIISVGWGGTAVKQWLPGDKLYKRLELAITQGKKYGIRAFLWHQGESDVTNKTTANEYSERLQTIIDQTHKDLDKNIPWIIAQVAFIPDGNPSLFEPVLSGQKNLITKKMALEGPTTEDIIGDEWRGDRIHFNEKGLKEHGKRWAEAIIKHFF